MRQTDNITNTINELKNEIQLMKSKQPVAPVDWKLFRYKGTITSDGSNKYIILDTGTNRTDAIVIFIRGSDDFVMHYFTALISPNGIFYTEMKDFVGTQNYQIMSNLSGTVSISNTKPN